MRRIDRLVPIMLLCAPLSCAAAETAPAGEEKLAVQGETADAAASAPAAAAKTPRIEFWGDYRWLYGKARMELPSVGKKQDVYLSTRRFRIAPTIHLGEVWSNAECSRICAMTRTQSRAHRSRPL